MEFYGFKFPKRWCHFHENSESWKDFEKLNETKLQNLRQIFNTLATLDEARLWKGAPISQFWKVN